ncbi:KDO2-lipid IV(A) lauroyltransferase [Mesonia hippocampi]|uniref:KDO2-lipid IV(A) lauroyltransferase n=1 Tax=Mesonia hippocampi TaxID=1628250 RepID=A0A840EL46_9FLAO|nr:lysophospholipid acyltransferase family protein [Mesonia hippocampi]MBB4117821.1 KDO2-lipid IV(A) lauroyltransferase [Mesonia hippocampi]
MQRFIYIISYPLLWFISKLPFKGIYLVATAVSFIVFNLIGYRRKVITSNLTHAFPNKSKQEIKEIKTKFHLHFCDLFLEMIKSLTITDDELKKRFVITNPEELTRLQTLNKSHVVMMGHYASYEWVTALHYYGLHYKGYGIYKRIKNPYFDKLIRKIRSRQNTTMLDTKTVHKQMFKDKQDKVLASYGMIADQAPKGGNTKYWRNFLGREVPVFIGSEVIAKRLDYAITYLQIEKVKRGYYQATFIPITDNPKDFEDYKITDKYFELLEKQIIKQPEYYLWSHKRWKHAK